MVLKKCPNCGNRGDSHHKFCSECGHEFEIIGKPKYVGKYVDEGIYRITFVPVEIECSSKDSAEDVARHSAWGEDREFEGFQVEKVRSTCTKETHPYICGGCQNVVTDDMSGICSECGQQKWLKR